MQDPDFLFTLSYFCFEIFAAGTSDTNWVIDMVYNVRPMENFYEHNTFCPIPYTYWKLLVSPLNHCNKCHDSIFVSAFFQSHNLSVVCFQLSWNFPKCFIDQLTLWRYNMTTTSSRGPWKKSNSCLQHRHDKDSHSTQLKALIVTSSSAEAKLPKLLSVRSQTQIQIRCGGE